MNHSISVELKDFLQDIECSEPADGAALVEYWRKLADECSSSLYSMTLLLKDKRGLEDEHSAVFQANSWMWEVTEGLSALKSRLCAAGEGS